MRASIKFPDRSMFLYEKKWIHSFISNTASPYAASRFLSIDISDKNIRNREKDFLPPAFSKNGPERAGSHPVELFSRTGRTCYGFQIFIRSKEEEEEEEEEEDDDEDDEMSGTPYTLPAFRQRTTVREFPFT